MSARPAFATFHSVQIEQVIGGVNGDTSAQAIQLRLRFPGDNLLGYARLRVWDARGENPITLANLGDVPNAFIGARVLVASANCAKYTNRPIAADFIIEMQNLIPDSYLAAGRLTYEGIDETIYWSLSFGGSAYTGPNRGSAWNDTDGDFGPPFDGPIPSDGVQALLFQGSALDLSDTNLGDYALTAGPAVFTNNAGQSAKLCEIDLSIGTNLEDFALFQSCFTNIPGPIAVCCETADFNGDEAIDLTDYALFQDALTGP
jgi:hypothetical protein